MGQSNLRYVAELFANGFGTWSLHGEEVLRTEAQLISS